MYDPISVDPRKPSLSGSRRLRRVVFVPADDTHISHPGFSPQYLRPFSLYYLHGEAPVPLSDTTASNKSV
ncbi:MAG: hypothetical protein AAF513_19195 [Pseudomonadota bacterium]